MRPGTTGGGEEDWGEVPAFITVHADNHLEMPVDENGNLSWEGVRDASTLNPEDIPYLINFLRISSWVIGGRSSSTNSASKPGNTPPTPPLDPSVSK